MPEPAPPGEPGYDPDNWFQHVVYTGLRIARGTGLGLALFNGLRSRFPGVMQSILGAVATMIGQGVRAAFRWNDGGPGYQVHPDELPLTPRGFFGPEEVDRIVGLVDLPGIDQTTGETLYHNTRINFPEDWSKSAVEEIADDIGIEQTSDLCDGEWQIDFAAKKHMTFIGKRF